MPRIRGRLYSSCASSTWSLPSALRRVLGEDVEDELRAVDDAQLELVLEAALLARDRGRRRRRSDSASDPATRLLQLDELALARRRCGDRARAGAGRALRPARRPAVRRSSRISASSSSSSTPWASTATRKPRSGSAPGAGSGWWWVTARLCPGSRRGAKLRSGRRPPRGARRQRSARCGRSPRPLGPERRPGRDDDRRLLEHELGEALRGRGPRARGPRCTAWLAAESAARPMRASASIMRSRRRR